MIYSKRWFLIFVFIVNQIIRLLLLTALFSTFCIIRHMHMFFQHSKFNVNYVLILLSVSGIGLVLIPQNEIQKGKRIWLFKIREEHVTWGHTGLQRMQLRLSFWYVWHVWNSSHFFTIIIFLINISQFVCSCKHQWPMPTHLFTLFQYNSTTTQASDLVLACNLQTISLL